jgi:hypothetical protein
VKQKFHWRSAEIDPKPPYCAYVRTGRNSMLGMNFSSLCMRTWMSTVWHAKPTPYPPAEKDCCPVCWKESQ